MGRDRLIVVAHPLDVGLVVGRVWPHAGDHRGEVRAAIRERRRVRRDPVASAIDRVDVDRRVDDGYLRPVREMRLDRRVGELGREVGLPIMLQAGWHQGIKRAVEHGVWHRADVFSDHGRRVAERLEGALPFVEWPGPARHNYAERIAVSLLRDEWEWGRDLEGWKTAELLRRVGDKLAKKAQDSAGIFQLIQDRAAVDILDGVEAELERSHHAEIATAAADRPEQVLVLVVARDEKLAVGSHHVG